MSSFWDSLPRPFMMLAPMEDVTDAAFRRLIARKGKPDVFYTEFTSADGLVRADESGQKKLRKKLEFSEQERPIVAQLFTSIPAHMEAAARMCAELGFDGVDINMGCPDRAVEKQKCGAALIKDPPLARELIRAAKRGAPTLPISVKTRLGYNEDILETWLPELLAEEPACVTIHARTRKEMSEVPAHWERVARAVEIRDELGSKTLIAGNGDVKNITDACAKADGTKCDGVMLGSAIFGNPSLFSRSQERENVIVPREKIEMLIEHIELFQELLSGTVSEQVMKRHFKAYISGWDNAKELRVQLMGAETLADAKRVLEEQLR